MKLLGASKGVNSLGEAILAPATLSEVTYSIFGDKNKSSSARCFQTALHSESVAMTDEGGNIAADNLIFNERQFNNVFITKFKNLEFMRTALAHNQLDYDAQISMFNFLPADDDNLALQKMLQSDRTAKDEDDMECDTTKHTKRTTNLFIDGYQVDRFHLYTCIGTFMCFIRVIFENGKESLIYKGFEKLLTYVKSSEGAGWLTMNTRSYPNTIHHLICELQILLAGVQKFTSNNDALVRMVKNGEEIPGAHATRITTVCDNMHYVWTQRCVEPVSTFINPPETVHWFSGLSKLFTKQLFISGQGQSGPPKKDEKKGGAPASGKPKGVAKHDKPEKDNPKRAVKTAEEKEKEKKGWLVYTGPGKKLPTQEIHDGKRLCGGWCYLGRYCSTPDCNRIHANGFESLTPEFQGRMRIWVNDKKNKVTWAPGREPKNSE